MDRRIAHLLQEGERAAYAGQKAEARCKFRAVLMLEPTNVPALLWLAWLNDEPRASLVYVARALEYAPNNPHVHAALRWARQRQETAIPNPPPSRSPDSQRSLQDIGLLAALSLIIILLSTSLTVSWPHNLPSSVAMALTPTLTVTLTSTSSPPPPSPTPTPTPTPSPFPTSTPTPSPQATWPTSLPTAPPLPPSLTPASSSISSEGIRWIDVDLTHQLLAAYEDQKLVRITAVSTGLPNTPTPVGQFHIWTKLRSDTMSGPGYYLTNVPYVMYFHGGYGLHGTYWHANFGHPMSHGCINLPTEEAKWLFNWADVGTLVNVHW